MRTEEFDYNLPQSLIAQRPLDRRDACRLLVLDRWNGVPSHCVFSDLAGHLLPGDRLVFNDTKVLPARLLCRKSSGGRVELLCTEPIGENRWKALTKPRLRSGSVLALADDPAAGVVRVGDLLQSGERVISLEEGAPCGSFAALIERYGSIPLPPYIKRRAETADRERYQTVYAASPGAVAAPTAGLHFTGELLAELRERGVRFTYVTLHVGIGTFLPVKVPDPRDHVMHEERYELSGQAAEEIMQTKHEGGRVVAVGTTVVRVLEHTASSSGVLHASRGRTNLKILPPYNFKIVDGLITNFHLPRSTLLMLVCAFAAPDRVRAAYQEAVREHYRFFSYGDAMFIR